MQKPFEIETIAWQELQRDRLFPLLTPAQCEFYVTAAMEIGACEAAQYRGEPILPLVEKLGACIEDYEDCEDYKDGNTIAGSEIYAEYDAVYRRIRLHRVGVSRLAARLGQALPEAAAKKTAWDLLAAHELFHHLEATRLGPVHTKLPPIAIPVLRGLWRVQRRVLRTREIAAHSFAYTLLGMAERFDTRG